MIDPERPPSLFDTSVPDALYRTARGTFSGSPGEKNLPLPPHCIPFAGSERAVKYKH